MTKLPERYTEWSEYVIERAEEQGLPVLIPDDYTLILDIDDYAACGTMNDRIKILEEFMAIKIVDRYTSSSGEPHEHVVIKVDRPFTLQQRLFLQLYLGSDGLKEILSFRDYLDGDPTPSLLIKGKLK